MHCYVYILVFHGSDSIGSKITTKRHSLYILDKFNFPVAFVQSRIQLPINECRWRADFLCLNIWQTPCDNNCNHISLFFGVRLRRRCKWLWAERDASDPRAAVCHPVWQLSHHLHPGHPWWTHLPGNQGCQPLWAHLPGRSIGLKLISCHQRAWPQIALVLMPVPPPPTKKGGKKRIVTYTKTGTFFPLWPWCPFIIWSWYPLEKVVAIGACFK